MATPGGGLAHGLTAGPVRQDPLAAGPRTGRARRWYYAAAGGPDVAVGAAVVSLGAAGTAFAWAWLGDRIVTWERRAYLGRGLTVGRVPSGGASYRHRDDTVVIGADGALTLAVATAAGPLRVRTTLAPDTPASLVTATPHGGWNVTQKAAGERATGTLELDGARHEIDGGGWRDWTSGRQDRRTDWRWAAAAGAAEDGRRVGLNAGTGMNGEGPGEHVVWWEGRPYPLEVSDLRPAGDDAAGPWIVGGPGWHLEFAPGGVRSAHENLVVVRSSYTQPVGRFVGTLPGPEGEAVEVAWMTGVTEDHEAVW